MPAAVVRLADLPAFGLATSLLLPYGIPGGVGCAVRQNDGEQGSGFSFRWRCSCCDNSIGRNGFFGADGSSSAPGSGYGLNRLRGAHDRGHGARMTPWNPRPGCDCGSVQFRAHIFVLFAPALAMTILWRQTSFDGARLIASAMLSLAAVGAVCVAVVPVARQHGYVSVFVAS
jgi:hypothetical protein